MRLPALNVFLSLAALTLSAACGAAAPGQPAPSAGSSAAVASPPPLVDARATGPLRPFATCAGPARLSLAALPGVNWHQQAPGTAQAGCHLSWTTSPVGGTLELSYQAAGNAPSEVRDRLRDLATMESHEALVRLPDLGVALLGGGAAFIRDDAASFLLYAATASSFVSVVCAVPAAVAKQPHDLQRLTATARTLLAWVITQQPLQV